MAALVAYPVASQHDRASGRQRTPQSRTGWDEVGYGDVSQELIFKIACNYLQNAALHMFSERCELSGGRDVRVILILRRLNGRAKCIIEQVP